MTDRLNSGAVIEEVVQMRRLRLAEQRFEHTRGYGRAPGNALCQFQGPGHQRFGFDAFESKTNLGGLGALDDPARKGQFGRPLDPDTPRQDPGAAVSGNDADIYKGFPEFCRG